jgi:PTS system ascorbate-specific IIB component
MKFLAVCGFGVGSSMVLKMSIEKAAKERGLEDVEVENTDLSSAKGSTADAIFTSQELGDELKGSTNAPVFPIKKYMDKEEVGQALDKFLENNK